jgi:origin recognition complex subunit 2
MGSFTADNTAEDAAPAPAITESIPTKTMTEWFQKNSHSAQADAMKALQLDYRFDGDTFGSMWWLHLQHVGFKHVGRHYELPGSDSKKTYLPPPPLSVNNKHYDATEIYEILDALAIPQVTSAFDPMPQVAEENLEKFHHSPEMVEWWRNVREELIFRKFHQDIERECAADKQSNQHHHSQVKTTKQQHPPQRPSIKESTLSGTTATEDAELFMTRKRKGRGRLGGGAASKRMLRGAPVAHNDTDLAFPTSLAEYQQMATHYKVQGQGDVVAADHGVQSFEAWRFLVSTNQSLLLYGAGSKRQLLQQFANEELDKDGDVLEIDGFDKDVTMEGILELFVDYWLDGREPSLVDPYHIHTSNDNRDMKPFYPLNGESYIILQAVAIAKRIAAIVSTTLRPVYVVLHNIDGIGLRNPTAQEALSVLVSQSVTSCGLNAIRLVASVDHVNAPALLWDSLTRHRFQWVWRQVHTQRAYIEEVMQSQPGSERKSRRHKAGNNRMGGADVVDHEDSAVQRDSIFSVLKSLASRHTQALQQLAWLQMESHSKQKESDEVCWVTYLELLNQCRLKCVVTQDTQLRNYLGELMDHHIVVRNRQVQSASATSYRIPYPSDVLELILDYQPDN